MTGTHYGMFTFVFICICLKEIECSTKKAADYTRKETGQQRKIATAQQLVPVTPVTNSPWQVAIHTRQGGEFQFRCGGTLISSDVVLTAAHCVSNPRFGPGELRVLAGERDRNSVDAGEQLRNVTSVTVHPDYVGTLTSLYNNDVALLKLASPVSKTTHVSPVSGLADDTSPTGPASCFVTGWGISAEKNGSSGLSGVLAQAEVTLLTNAQCNKRSNWDGLVKPSQLCAYSKKISACLGDSGGPLVCQVNSKYIQYGVTSWGKRTCDQKPVVYARVSTYRSWIMATINAF
ncbi:chymotrypsin-like protease CTRL-1 [Mya arenaria]|uniref:chymotrypsin-like protease CTRL-1 n=1 Tax=Mya arenaria TaxID=6604 RepID=UPI0022E840A7|nr:chymotrypsin-like protease CTRL-1 [Mya arenaria]